MSLRRFPSQLEQFQDIEVLPWEIDQSSRPEAEINTKQHTVYVSDHIHTPPTLQCQFHKTLLFLEDRVGTKCDLPHVPFWEGIAVLKQFHHLSDKLEGDGVFSGLSILRKFWTNVRLVEFAPACTTPLEDMEERDVGRRLTIRDYF